MYNVYIRLEKCTVYLHVGMSFLKAPVYKRLKEKGLCVEYHFLRVLPLSDELDCSVYRVDTPHVCRDTLLLT